jgi:4-hydroxy-tetrahydrodipicolinate synthase
LSGDDVTALDFIAHRGDGCISVAANVVPRLCGLMFEVADNQRWEEAFLLHRRLKPLLDALFVESNPVPLKCALGLMGLMNPELRLPLCEPAETTRAAVQKALTQVGALSPHFHLDAQARQYRLAG